ncbi:SagB family peptide dehydrogenase [Rhizobium leguminosarum]|uniref:SagB family peptide dehydrogenase n=1 Tax=Rhizobium leguminosarum TaxID=384 RepID=UPI0013EE8C17|nr:SagB family peptide dehydrogenase [Rhizobium leguminosarum]
MIKLTYHFNEEVSSVLREGQRITLDVKDWRQIGFTVKAPAHADAVMALRERGTTLQRLNAIAGDPAVAAYYIERFALGRLLSWTLADDKGELGRVASLANLYRPRSGAPPRAALSLCRFANLRRRDGVIVLESGATPARLVLSAPGLVAFADALCGKANGFETILWRLGFFDLTEPQESAARRSWEFHDLLMHETSRENRDADAGGGSYRFDGIFPAPPAIKPAMPGDCIVLPAVDPKRIHQASNSLHTLQERRKSRRTYADEPVALATLGEFLWRVCRTTRYFSDGRQDLISRPYPAGGSINELEFYIAVRDCSGLAPAVYHYDSHRHELVQLAESGKIALKIVDQSSRAMALHPEDRQPGLTVVIASRLPRIAWKYQRMAYRASLMNTGVVINLMYLVATDMGLAPCANGSGDSRLLEKATGIDRFEETAIAEFCIGQPAT